MPRPTRLGVTRPVISLTTTISGGDDGPPGQVPTTDDDGNVSWGSNVASVSVEGTRLIGPYINFAAGSNVTLTIDQGPLASTPSNTIRIHATVAGSGEDTAWMPLTTVFDGEPVLVWDDDDSLIPTLVPLE